MIYLHLNSNDSLAIHQHNSCADFICELPEMLHLNGEWECALVDIHGKSIPNTYNVFCDIIDHNVIKDRKLPILRQGLQSKSFQHLNFIKVIDTHCKRIRISITDSDLNPIENCDTPVYCILCLRKCG